MEDVLNDAKKIQDAGLVEAGYGWYPRVSKGGDWQFYQSYGGEMLDSSSGEVVFDKAAMQKVYEFFAKAVEMGVTRKNHIGTPWDQWYSKSHLAKRVCGMEALGTTPDIQVRKA